MERTPGLQIAEVAKQGEGVKKADHRHWFIRLLNHHDLCFGLFNRIFLQPQAAREVVVIFELQLAE